MCLGCTGFMEFGGATCNSSVNRDQIRDSVNIMGELVSVVIEIMMDSPNTLWG